MTLSVLLKCIAAICFLLAVHPFVTYPFSLVALKRFRRFSNGVDAPSSHLTFTICMCAYNEAAIIRKKAENLLQLKRREPHTQILVYVDGASDETAAILSEYAPAIECHVSNERRGKTHGMNLLVARASQPIVVFTDANVFLDVDCLEQLRHEFANPTVGCVCGNLRYTNDAESVTAATGSLYWRLEERIKVLEQQTGSVMGADGSLFAIRRELHRSPPDHIIDDMYVSFMILMDGRRIIQSSRARAYEHSASSSREEFRRKSRIACQAFNVHRLIWPKLRRMDALTVYKYLSHKLLRWLSIYFLVAGSIALFAALLIEGRLLIASALLGAGSVCFVLGALWPIKPFSQLIDVLWSLAGAGLGVWKSLRGELYQTWTPAASVRRAFDR